MPDRPSFHGLRVVSFEARRADALAALISAFGGQPMAAPALREVPLESNVAAGDFATALIRGEFDVVLCLTGVGTRLLLDVVDRADLRAPFVSALSRVRVVARGPKPLAVLRDLGVPVWVVAPEPNTWRELLAAVEAKAAELPLQGARVVVQEYGVPNDDLLDGLRQRGAAVTRVPLYRWALPEDLGPLEGAIRSLAAGEVDVALFTTGVQVAHLWEVAGRLGLEAAVRSGLSTMVVASIGPTTSAELRRQGVEPDVEASPPKMGRLVADAAQHAAAVLSAKRR